MTVKLSKKRDTVYVGRSQWAIGTDRDGNDIVGFGLSWRRKDSTEALTSVEECALETYEFNGETRRYHVWMEEVTRYDDGSEESVIVREYNRPTEPEPAPEDAPKHADYPHEAGRLPGCHACYMGPCVCNPETDVPCESGECVQLECPYCDGSCSEGH